MTEQERPRTRDWQDVYDLIDGTDYTVNDHAAREFIEKARAEGRQQAVREIRAEVEREPHSPSCEYGSAIYEILDRVAGRAVQDDGLQKGASDEH